MYLSVCPKDSPECSSSLFSWLSQVLAQWVWVSSTENRLVLINGLISVPFFNKDSSKIRQFSLLHSYMDHLCFSQIKIYIALCRWDAFLLELGYDICRPSVFSLSHRIMRVWESMCSLLWSLSSIKPYICTICY